MKVDPVLSQSNVIKAEFLNEELEQSMIMKGREVMEVITCLEVKEFEKYYSIGLEVM
jgi:hypothetical protein